MAGRRVGSEGHELARDYIVEQFEEAGLEPAGTDGWFTPTEVVWNVDTARKTELRVGDTLLARGVDYRPLGFSDDLEVSAEAVFVGYGISDPAKGWDDYADIEVAGRVVVVLTDAPIDEDLGSSATTDDAKAATALARGAVGILLVNAPRTHGDLPEQRPDELEAMRPSSALEGIGAARLTRRAGVRIFEGIGLDLVALQERLDAGEAVAQPLGMAIDAVLAVDRDTTTAENIVGRLPGRGSGAPVVLGAHYDHLGEGIVGSLWKGEAAVHPGADDNASGIAVIIEAARRLQSRDHRRPILIAATTGEEVGLRGARRLSRALDGRGAVYVNLDMVGRLRDPGLRLLGLEETPGLRASVRDAARAAEIEVVPGELYDSPSDHIAFFEAGFSVLHVTTGRHPDYHLPSDTADRLNLEGLERVSYFVTELVGSIAR
jgi:hypothetical protein